MKVGGFTVCYMRGFRESLTLSRTRHKIHKTIKTSFYILLCSEQSNFEEKAMSKITEFLILTFTQPVSKQSCSLRNVGYHTITARFKSHLSKET